MGGGDSVGRPNPLFTTRNDRLRDRLVIVTDHLGTQQLVQTALEAQQARVVSPLAMPRPLR
jgi:hypothetical protein